MKITKTKVAFIVCTISAFVYMIALSLYQGSQLQKLDIPETVQAETKQPQTIQDVQVAPTYYDCPLANDLQDYLFGECANRGVDPTLMIAIMAKESCFNASEISATNDYGLMQINACHKSWLAKQYGITNLLDPYQNIKAGAIMLGNLSSKYDGIEQIAMAYNLGESGAKSAFAKGIYSTNYSIAVKTNYNYYAGQGVQR